MLRAWFWTSGRFFATPFFASSVILGAVLSGGSVSNLNTWLALIAGLLVMAGGHSLNTWGDWKTGLDSKEGSVEKDYSGGCALISRGILTPTQVAWNGVMWYALSAIPAVILATRVGYLPLIPWALAMGVTFWYSLISKFTYTHELALSSGIVLFALLGAWSTGTMSWGSALLVSVPISFIFCFAGLALDEYPDAEANLKKGVKSLAFKVYERGYDLSLYVMMWVTTAFLVQFFLIVVGILKPWTGLTLIVLPLFIGGSVFLKPKHHRGAYISNFKNDLDWASANQETFKRAALFLVVVGMLYPVLVLVGQVVG